MIMRNPKEIKIRDIPLDVILENHKHWLNEDCKGWKYMKAKFHLVDLSYVDLRGADLRYVDFSGTNLFNADLRGADLSDTELRGTNLFYTDLRGADLFNANLFGANLFGADLRNAKNVPYIPLACPSDGAFVGWKKCQGLLIKLKIPSTAKRSSATTKKCRCDKAKVLGIYHDTGSKATIDTIINDSLTPTRYTIGEMVYPDSFDEDRWNECSHGIHFFVNKQDAINY